MRSFLIATALVLAAGAAQAAAPPQVRDTSSVDATGGRILQDVVVVHATPAAAWRAMTEVTTYRRWAAPAAWMDLRVGGLFEVGYDPKATLGQADNVRQQIIAYLPDQLLVFRNVHVGAVPGAPAYGALAIIVQLKDLGHGDTEVSLSQVGYGRGPDDDKLYAFFREHNPEYLAMLKGFLEAPSGR